MFQNRLHEIVCSTVLKVPIASTSKCFHGALHKAKAAAAAPVVRGGQGCQGSGMKTLVSTEPPPLEEYRLWAGSDSSSDSLLALAENVRGMLWVWSYSMLSS